MVIGERSRVSLKNVLLAVDFSETSLIALPYAASIAQHFGGKVFLAHVTEQSNRPPLSPQMQSTLDKLFESAEEGAIAAVPGLLPTAHETVLDYGSVCPTLLTVATKCNIDLIVIGTHGSRSIRKMIQGSKSREIVSLSTKPVLVVGPRISTKPEFRRILYVTDFSNAATHALPITDSLRETYNSILTVLHVNDGDTEENASDATPLMDKFVESARRAGYDELSDSSNIILEFGPRAERILEVATRCRADLIVIGMHVSKGLSARLAAHLPGSVTFDVISQAHCPVLTVSCSHSPAAPGAPS